ncbi:MULTISPECIES: L-aspartate oxidase [Lactococcus]|uniref:L-aspartate oxidase n=1 Tax=Lactococcus formosensis TaxID=1281486 RepID=A0A9X4P324_9LACT|nr:MULTISPECIES: L-aspartate oxidase [Lactococcus]MDG6112486.1 L-aspartate oxidase [Lactococcus formosensis]MDG6114542.1 L-aspartate oxidase [Lactococcus formosensis]MDG6116686.1 L-aspartate oxidase [Lactococcus formosensis]MDG6118740.1 L-aspartate oxidase [Lactococcus formosensis]MDG6120768.1 L-aspartate oxidase [Lactococcus formosensis]
MKKVVIIGSGLAGSIVAYYLGQQVEITILTKGTRGDSNSMLAQGGIAAVLSPKDKKESHIRDTLIAGEFHNSRIAVNFLVENGPEVIKDLIHSGLIFDRDESGNLSFGLEGAHSFSRIVHSGGDRTGKNVTEFVQNKLSSKIKWIESAMAVSWKVNNNKVTGLSYLDSEENIQMIDADIFVLASGGVGQLFNLTTNDKTVTGDGLAMTIRAEGKLTDLEFLQFHPTLLSVENKIPPILISEAVRGAGAVLISGRGDKIMIGRHPKENLAPRDVVSRVVNEYIKKGDKVYLDISMVKNFETRFPFISDYLLSINVPFQVTKKIPIQPGMHFLMGGIKTTLKGETSLKNLYAVGEVACTGVHGANRLASNSLLEILAFGRSVAHSILKESLDRKNKRENLDTLIEQINPKEIPFNLPEREILIQKVSNSLGIVRKRSEVCEFIQWLKRYQFEFLPEKISKENLETANLCLVSEKIALAILKRKISLGAHYIIQEENELQ